jgi:hypothetical protein
LNITYNKLGGAGINLQLFVNTNYSGDKCTLIQQDQNGDVSVGGVASGTWRMLGLTTSANSYWLGVRVS